MMGGGNDSNSPPETGGIRVEAQKLPLGLSLVTFSDDGYTILYHKTQFGSPKAISIGRKDSEAIKMPRRAGLGSSRGGVGADSAVYGLSAKEFSRLFLPRAHDLKAFEENDPKPRGILEIGIGNLQYISYPVRITHEMRKSGGPIDDDDDSDEDEDEDEDTGGKPYEEHKKHRHRAQGRHGDASAIPSGPRRYVKAFNVVFGLTKSVLTERLRESFRFAVRNLSLALKSEEIRCSYVSTEMQHAISAAEKQQHDRKRTQTKLVDAGSGRHAGGPGSITAATATAGSGGGGIAIPKRWPLENTLDEILLGLCSMQKIARVTINGWLGFDLTIGLRLRDISKTNIRPHHSLLLGDKPTNVLRRLPPSASPILVKLVEGHDPTKSFQELATIFSVRLERLLRLARHLVVWRLGKIVPTITALSIYGVPPATMPSTSGHYGVRGVAGLLGAISDEFERTFQKSFSLPSFLAIFNRLLPLKRHVADWMERGLDKLDLSLMLRWAVNKNLLVPYKRYIYLLPLASGNACSPGSPLHIKVVRPNSDVDRRERASPSSPSHRYRQSLQQKGRGGEGGGQHASKLISSLADGSREYQILRGVFEAGCLDGRTELTEIVWQWNSTETMLYPSRDRSSSKESRGGVSRELSTQRVCGGEATVVHSDGNAVTTKEEKKKQATHDSGKPSPVAVASSKTTKTNDDDVKSALIRFRHEHEQRAITVGAVLKMVAKYEEYIALVVRASVDD